MCGIVGYVGHGQAVPFLIPALRRLEYRGYDSAGLATLDGSGIELHRVAGRIAGLESLLRGVPCGGHLGIAHTRWATHGRPSERNAHPHLDCHGRFAVVHNGIIENYRELRGRLAAEGHRFRSETDTEVVAHLIEAHFEGDLVEAVRRASHDLAGAYAIACIAENAPETLVALRKGGSPLILGHGQGETYLASDIPALLGVTRRVTVLEEGQLAVLTPQGVTLHDDHGPAAACPVSVVEWDAEAAEKTGYPHFMLKEIFEQPAVVRATIGERLDATTGEVHLPELGLGPNDLKGLNRLCFVACGTSWHAGLVGKHLVESWARLPVDADVASELRYRDPVMDSRVLAVSVSQSGETADTLAALKEARRRGCRAIAVCNVVGSSVAREADGVVYTRAGLEIGVASTKSFTTQLAALTLLALKLGVARQFLERETARALGRELQLIPSKMERILAQSERIRELAQRHVECQHAVFLGRGLHYPLALEGALKLKEISYIHAEGLPAGEMKHGPIALIDPGMLVVALNPRGSTYDKMASNIEEVRARGARPVTVVVEGDDAADPDDEDRLIVPSAPEWLQPMLVALPLQLFAYHVAALLGRDIDQPRNLAKSVTVE